MIVTRVSIISSIWSIFDWDPLYFIGSMIEEVIVDLIDDLLLKFTENYNKYTRNEWSLLRPTLQIKNKNSSIWLAIRLRIKLNLNIALIDI